ncbi:MAG: murein hydrolase activator EnvC family protein [Candidatus Krumholzibacteriia bacterium]
MLAAVLAACLAPDAAVQAQPPRRSLARKITNQQQELEKIRKNIERLRRKNSQLKREEQSMMQQLSSLDREISLAGKLIAGLEEREQLLGEQIDSLRISIEHEGGTLEQQRARLAARLRQMYKRGPNHRWQVILGSANLQEAFQKYKFMGLIAERDAGLVEEVRGRKSWLEQERVLLTEAMADVVTLKTQRVDESNRMKSNKKTRVSMLKRIRGEKAKHTQAIAELKKSEEKLKDLIGDLERKRLSGDTGVPLAGEFTSLKGKLMRPVKGRVTRQFGQDRHPKFGTVTFNNGINIKAPAGTPIRSVAPAKVEFVDWITGYGNCIILNHGDGYYTLYAHASKIFVEPGQIVAAGDVIAEVGDSGSLNGYECHFEIRKSKEALNPTEWFSR